MTKWPQGAYAAEAKERINDLSNRETKQMYDDFSKFDPKPVAPATGGPAAKTPAFDLPSDRPANPGDVEFEHKFDGAQKPNPSKARPKRERLRKRQRSRTRSRRRLQPAKGTAPGGGDTKKAESKKTEPTPEKSKK